MKIIVLLVLLTSLAFSQQFLMLKNKGLYTYWNEYSQETPVGSMAVANNVVIDRKNVVESRRGFNDTYVFGNTSDRAEKVWFYKDKLFAHMNDDVISYYTGSAWSDYSGTYTVADSNLGRIKTAQAAQNLYLCTNDGVKKLDALIIVSDSTSAGLKAAERIFGLAEELNIEYKNIFMIVNRVNKKSAVSAGFSIEVLGTITRDPELADSVQANLVNLGEDKNIVRETNGIFSRILERSRACLKN